MERNRQQQEQNQPRNTASARGQGPNARSENLSNPTEPRDARTTPSAQRNQTPAQARARETETTR